MVELCIMVWWCDANYHLVTIHLHPGFSSFLHYIIHSSLASYSLIDELFPSTHAARQNLSAYSMSHYNQGLPLQPTQTARLQSQLSYFYSHQHQGTSKQLVNNKHDSPPKRVTDYTNSVSLLIQFFTFRSLGCGKCSGMSYMLRMQICKRQDNLMTSGTWGYWSCDLKLRLWVGNLCFFDHLRQGLV